MASAESAGWRSPPSCLPTVSRCSGHRRADRPAPGELLGRRVLVSAGGTREPIDSVRFIGNRSSGRMGYALAQQRRRRGARGHDGVRQRRARPARRVCGGEVQTAAELAAACGREFDASDVLLMAAAVADFRPRDPASEQTQEGPWRAADRAGADATMCSARLPSGAAVRARCWSVSRPSMGSGAVASARAKLERKRLDAVVVNDISQPGNRL